MVLGDIPPCSLLGTRRLFVILLCSLPFQARSSVGLFFVLSFTRLLLLLLLLTAVELSLGGSTKQIRLNIHKRNNTKAQYKLYKTQ